MEPLAPAIRSEALRGRAAAPAASAAPTACVPPTRRVPVLPPQTSSSEPLLVGETDVVALQGGCPRIGGRSRGGIGEI